MSTEGDSDDDYTTPDDLALRRPASTEARAIADLALSLAALATDIGTTSRRVDAVAGAERAGLLVGLARQLGDAADAMHEARRIVSDMTAET